MTSTTEARLAIVVPVHNELGGIRPTLAALTAQRDQDFDVVFVDNGSTDDSVAIILGFVADRPRWRVIREPQKGTGAGADTGMRAAIAAGAGIVARTASECLPTACSPCCTASTALSCR